MAGALRHDLPDPLGRRRRALRRLPLLLLVGAVPTVLIQAPWAAGGDGAAQEEPQMVRGQRLYAANCASCHGRFGGGTAQGPTLLGVGEAAVDLQLSTGRMPIADPDVQPVRSAPAFPAEDIEALVAFVASLGPPGPPIPTVDAARGTLARGRQVYAANCLACHGAGGQGANVGAANLAPPLAPATSTQVAEAVRIGPGVMPPFGEEVLGQEDLDSLVRYVLFLREAEGRGGQELGRVGPVMEGFIAWFIGMGLLVLAIRLTGTRA